ncbi:HET-domain-containing protein [Trichodelitschia bisporula]|uniref:HET-domain-containing protein n=1 Tax=Trichodelitschia bisporula TaxID=703511 RepID=A0A6G1HPE0_9PEZI|nr:HET-domain-containing protein [Trichodelitschia bisporula]
MDVFINTPRPEWAPDKVLGGLLEIMSSPCEVHKPFLAEHIPTDGTPLSDDRSLFLMSRDIEGFGYVPIISVKPTVRRLVKLRTVEHLELIGPPLVPLCPHKTEESPGRLQHREIDVDWIDDSLPYRWKSTCDREHGVKCQVLLAPWALGFRPALLVDVWLKCLIPGNVAKSYVALSYVWGKKEFRTTHQSDLAKLLCVVDALSESNKNFAVPDTIRRAMVLTEMLGEQYLWVDALCIVQDQKETQKQEELGQMALIYANASVTIICANGESAFDGFRGLKGVSPSRSLPPQTCEVGGLKIIKDANFKLDTSLWNTRGWTFQEWLFSRRRLVFSNTKPPEFLSYPGSPKSTRAYWECNECRWQENHDNWNLRDSTLSDNTSGAACYGHPPFLFRSMFEHRIPKPALYSELVSRYSRRELTNSEDIIRAFSGIASVLSYSFKGGFISGLPVVSFDLSLLWEPRWPMNGLRRRRCCVPAPGLDSTGPLFPSWSWMGGYGPSGSFEPGGLQHFGYRQDLFERRWNDGSTMLRRHVEPLVKWHWQAESNSTQHPIDAEWYAWRQQFRNNTSTPCPKGWTRYLLETDSCGFYRRHPRLEPEAHETMKCFYKHESDPESTYWHPVPVPEDTAPPSIPIIQARLISGRTRRGWANKATTFRGYPSTINSSWNENPAAMAPFDSDGYWLGLLAPHDPPSGEEVLDWGENGTHERIELVEIVRGYGTTCSELGKISYLFRIGFTPVEALWPKSNGGVEYYGVLCIQWKDGIAYRKGVGYVVKDYWEDQELEWIDLVLG